MNQSIDTVNVVTMTSGIISKLVSFPNTVDGRKAAQKRLFKIIADEMKKDAIRGVSSGSNSFLYTSD